MARRCTTTDWQRALVLMSGAVLAVVIVGALYWAQAVLVPVALAVFFSFLLGPLVTRLQSRGLPRGPAVIGATLVAVGVLLATGWIITRQMVSMADELQKPQYTENIKHKVKAVREFTGGLTANRLGRQLQEISDELQMGRPQEDASDKPRAGQPVPPRIVIEEKAAAWPTWVAAALAAATESLAGLALAVVLVIFILLNRESLRDRMIRLAGQGHLTATTRAVDDAAQRISRFLLVQLCVNCGFGAALSAGLLLIGVPYALLWGFLAAMLRYIPYLGAWIAAIAPVLLSIAVFDSWGPPLLTMGFIAILELTTNNVVEPRAYGHSMGVSEVALLVAAAFWTFLWGPVGLVLSSPLTVCLVVLGKHVPQLEFFDILLGDEPALAPHVTFYQRLLARDRGEALELAKARAKASDQESTYEELLLPALSRCKRDRRNDELTDGDEQVLLESIDEIAEKIDAEQSVDSDTAPIESRQLPGARVDALFYPAQDEADRIALGLLARLLDPVKWNISIGAVETLASELVRQVAEQKPAIVCIGSLAPGGLAHARYLCKRLRGHFPELKISIARFGSTSNLARLQSRFRSAGANHVETRLREIRTHLTAWLPVLAQKAAEPQSVVSNDHAA
jgi:predicted PurR-regulated permease PerM